MTKLTFSLILLFPIFLITGNFLVNFFYISISILSVLNFNKKDDAIQLIIESRFILKDETEWRFKGKDLLLNNLIALLNSGEKTFALRKQDQLNKEQALYLARCKSVPKDISLYF